MSYTENNALTNPTTLSPLLDLFAVGGALRNREASEVISLFDKASKCNSTLTNKYLFYLRDIRGGLGERKTFRIILKHLLQRVDNAYLIDFIAEYGRWDDMFQAFDTPTEDYMVSIIDKQLRKDLKLEAPSLLGKWMPSENTSSRATRKLAKRMRTALKMNVKVYRKSLTSLRKKIKIVESLMSSKQWTEIKYETVPSNASLRYRKAFSRNDADRYVQYLEDVKSGVKTIKATTLFPYDIVRPILNERSNQDETLELQWNALPDYMNDERMLVVADTSGSMYGSHGTVRPIDVSVSLALYSAERLRHPAFKNLFMTFSSRPQLVRIVGDTLHEKVRNINKAKWGMNTNIQAVFSLILQAGVQSEVPESEMPNRIVIVSDMEFDSCGTHTNLDVIKTKYIQYGYKMPKLVFWNVNSKRTQFPATINDDVILVSGASASTFKTIMSNKSAEDVMLDTLLSERYKQVF